VYVRSIQFAANVTELEALGAACKVEPLFKSMEKQRPASVAEAYVARSRALEAT
jgi:hypothetical protein